jgi:tetratricopeptide (TPR) repeat protein
MSTTFRAAPLLLILILSLITPVPVVAQSSPASSDEEILQQMTEQYGTAITAGDLEGMRKFWNPESPNLKTRLGFYRNMFAAARIEFISSKVTRLEVTDGKAVSHLTTDERRLDKKTGAVLLTYDPFRGACRAFEWIKTNDGWKIQREFLVQDELAARLEATATEKERDELLEKEKVFVTNTLVDALANRGLRYQVHAKYDEALRAIQLQQVVAERIGDQAGLAEAFLNRGLVKNTQEDHEFGLQLTHKALAMFEALGVKCGMALAQENLSNLYRAVGDNRRAFGWAQKSLRLSEEIGHRRYTMTALDELAIIYGQQNNSEQALAHYQRALAIAQDLGDKIMIATVRHDIAIRYKKMGLYDKALEIYRRLLQQTEAFGDHGGAAMIRDQIGQIFSAQGRYTEALNYHSQAITGLEAVIKKSATVVSLNNSLLLSAA